MFTDNCDPDPVVEFTEEIMPFPPNNLIIIRCWTGIDLCGNTSPTFCQNITILGEPPNGPQLQGPAISLTVASQPDPDLLSVVRPVFSPGSAHWEDNGIIQSLPQRGISEELYHVFPPVAVEMELQLQPGITVFAGAGFSRTEIMSRYGTGTNTVSFSGSINGQSCKTGLRYEPEAVQHIFFYTAFQFVRYRVSSLQLEQDNMVVTSDTELSTFGTFQTIGAGARFAFGDFGVLELASQYSSDHRSAILSHLKINLTSLLQPRKRKQE
jgi:hypothetical protein